MNRHPSGRRHFRRSLPWHVFYGSEELVKEGTILDMNETACRIAGCMPVEAGTRLRLCIWSSQSPEDIVVAQGTVKWAKGLHFGLILDQVNVKNHFGSLHSAG